MDVMFSLFDDPSTSDEPPRGPVMMSDAQRAEIRALFGVLNIGDARTQFDFVAEVTGSRIGSVAELDAANAHRLIGRLRSRVENGGKTASGSSWDHRDEDTWIDRL